MKFLSADWIFPLCEPPIKEGVIQISNKGEIIQIFNNRNKVPLQKVQIFKGLICPGFVNSHCHLELSHLHGLDFEAEGFLDFLSIIQTRNDFHKEEIQRSIQIAESQMIQEGIVAVGDICNTDDTIFQKKQGNLCYYNFIEIFEVKTENNDDAIQKSLSLRSKFRNSGMLSTIVPHAPYSISPELVKKISLISDSQDHVFSIHNQETKHENELLNSKEGVYLLWLKSIGASPNIWEERESPLSIIKEINTKKNIILVHNTFTSSQDLKSINDKIYFCTCPKSNLFIEKSLPDYDIFNLDRLCIGTDSLASNSSLSILEEIKVILDNTNIKMNTLLTMACKNGAEALGFHDLGTFEKGKYPGVNLIQNFNVEENINIGDLDMSVKKII